MINMAYSVYDSAANAYLPPFFIHSEKMAMRSFQDAVNDQSHQFNKHPEDYILHRIGTFDDVTGQLDPCIPVKVMSALEATGTAEITPFKAEQAD